MPVYALIVFGVSKSPIFSYFERLCFLTLHLKSSSLLDFTIFSSVISFQCYSLATIGYRVATFNDCEEASESLKQVFHLLSNFSMEFPFVEFL